jgi:hypothetical protein
LYTGRGETIHRQQWRGQHRGFGYGYWHDWSTLLIVSVPYWPIVLILTLLSAFLLLLRPLNSDQKSIAEPTCEADKGLLSKFFHGWRRKVGLVTLMAACVLMMAWFRSLSIADVVTIKTQESHHNLVFAKGKLEWSASDDGYSTPRISWDSHPADKYLQDISIRARAGMSRRPTWNISYWVISLPLTLVSLLLLLSKPRHLNQKKITEPTATDGM